MADPHQHQWTYPHLRLLTLRLPDGLYRVYTDRSCRHCDHSQASTGSATKREEACGPLPWMGTFWGDIA